MSTCWKRASWLGALLATLALVACRGGDDDRAATPASVETAGPTETADPTATATETPVPATPTPRGTVLPDDTIVVACGDILAPLDKTHRLTEECVPPDLEALPPEMVASGGQLLRKDAAAAYRELFAAAQKDGYIIVAASAYRNYQAQVSAHQSHVNRGGQAYADRVSARPGHSEHQLGTTTDVTSATVGYGLESFEGTPEAAWLAENSWKYGFIVSYPEGKEPITGYKYEPWHIRWLGTNEAARVRGSGLTLHEYLLR